MTAKRCGWAPVEGLTRLEGFQEPWEKVHPPRLVLSCAASAPCIVSANVNLTFSSRSVWMAACQQYDCTHLPAIISAKLGFT